MELNKLKFVINESGNISKDDIKKLEEAYRTLFIEIYGYDILTEYLSQKPKAKKSLSFQDTFVDSIDVIQSVRENENISLLLIYFDETLIGFGRIKQIKPSRNKNALGALVDNLLDKYLHFTHEKMLSVPDVAITKEYAEFKNDIWKKAIEYVEMYASENDYDRLFVEIPINSPLLFRADDLGFIESPEDMPIDEKPRTSILNKSIERTKDEEFNSSRK